MTGREPGLHFNESELNDLLDGMDTWISEYGFTRHEGLRHRALYERRMRLRNKIARRLGVREEKVLD